MKQLKYEDAARRVFITDEAGNKIGEGWQSIPGGAVWPDRNGQSDEHHARYTSATDFPCKCGSRMEKGLTCCRECRQKIADEKWFKDLAEKGIDWDGETPLAENDGDRFVFSEDDLCDYLDRHISEGGTIDSVRLVLAKADNGPCFEMMEFLCDSLPDEDHGGQNLDTRDIDKIVNDWIKSHAPFSYWADGVPIKPESLAKYVPQDDPA